MTPPTWAIIADDLTGACDAAAPFASRGLSTVIGLSIEALPGGGDVRVLSTASRAMPPDLAAQHVIRSARNLIRPGDRVYQKIDSTLRGNPGEELRALLRAVEELEGQARAAVVCPAFPKQGRTVRDGKVFVRGVPLAETEFAVAVREPDLMKIFSPCIRVTLEQTRGDFPGLVEALSHPGVFVADAETEDDLRRLAQAGTKAVAGVFCGSAGMASALAGSNEEGGQFLPLPAVNRPVLVVAGSRSMATVQQVEILRGPAEVVDASLESAFWDTKEPDMAACNRLALRIVRLLEVGRSVVLSVGSLPFAADGQPRIAGRLGSLSRVVLDRVSVGGLVLTGGETAAAVLYALESTAFRLGGEVEPGVAWGVLASGPFRGLPVVTKAGGFGDPAALFRATQFLQGVR